MCFDNKVEIIKHRGRVLWHIKRKNNLFAIHTEHESEHGTNDEFINCIIHNDGDMDHLRAQAAGAMAGLAERDRDE